MSFPRLEKFIVQSKDPRVNIQSERTKSRHAGGKHTICMKFYLCFLAFARLLALTE